MFALTERRGPHKSMHCKFCKPPGTIYFSDIPSPAQLETKTKLHLCHETADLKIYDIYDEPGYIEEETEACICQLEGVEPCPKCAPDKTVKPVKKKVCNCPLGAKPHANMAVLNVSNKKKKKEKKNNDEFWWEKYDREHDAKVKEIWAAYMAQRKLDRKESKVKALENLRVSGLLKPTWFHKLSCQQTTYLEYLSTAIRLDLDEKITDRTSFVLRGIGFYPRPTKKILQKCLRYSRYNTIRFLNQLWLFYQEEDPYGERIQPRKKTYGKSQILYSWNDRIVMACICHLEFPKLLREIMDRLPPLPQQEIPPYVSTPKLMKKGKKQNGDPYEEPVWIDQIDWLEQRKIDRMNKYREHLNRRRVKIPNLALVRRPSLIDARPPFLSQIEANQSFPRRRKSMKKKESLFRKKKKAVFDSKVDVTAIAGIEASEVSTTPKADPDELCVFLRDRSLVTESIPEAEENEFESEEGEEEDEEEDNTIEPILDAKVKFGELMSTKSGSSNPMKTFDETLYVLDDATDEDDDIPFVTPPKTYSGRTIEEPCPPPKSSPGPPALHFDEARREIGFINEELCIFDPNEVKSEGEEKGDMQSVTEVDIEYQLKQVVRKLRELNLGEEEEEEEGEEAEEIPRIPKKKRRRKKKSIKQGKGESNKKSKTGLKNKRKSSELKEKVEEVERVERVELIIPVDEPEDIEIMEEEGEESSESCVCGLERETEKKKIKTKPKTKRKKSKKRKRSKKRKTKKKKKDIFNPCGDPNKLESGEGNILEVGDFRTDLVKKVANENEVTEDETKSEESDSSEEFEKKEEEEKEGEKVFYGNVLPLLKVIMKDLNEEGFISAGFEEIYSHPDVVHLMKYLRGEILTNAKKASALAKTQYFWRILMKNEKIKPVIPLLNVPKKRLRQATWNDKKWLTNLIKKNKDKFYYYVARNRSIDSKSLYLSLHQEYFYTDRFLSSFYAYMIAAWHESIVKGLM